MSTIARSPPACAGGATRSAGGRPRSTPRRDRCGGSSRARRGRRSHPRSQEERVVPETLAPSTPHRRRGRGTDRRGDTSGARPRQGIGREELVAVAGGVEGLRAQKRPDERRARRTGRRPPARNRKADRLTEPRSCTSALTSARLLLTLRTTLPVPGPAPALAEGRRRAISRPHDVDPVSLLSAWRSSRARLLCTLSPLRAARSPLPVDLKVGRSRPDGPSARTA